MLARSRMLVLLAAALGVAALAVLGFALSGGDPLEAARDLPRAPVAANVDAEGRPVPDPAGRSVLPATDCLAPERLATSGPSPRCVIAFDRALAALGVASEGTPLVVSLTHAASASWALPQATLLRPFAPLPPMSEARVILVRTSPPVALLAIGSRLEWYDTDSGSWLEAHEGPGGTIQDVAWSADGSRLLVATAGDGRAHLLDGDARGLRSLRTDGQALLVAIDAPGRRAAVATGIGGIALFDLASDAETPERVVTPSLQPAAGIAFAGERLVVAGSDGTLRVIDAASGEETARVATGSPLVHLAVAPDGRRAATAGRDRRVRVHALPGGAIERELAWHPAGIAFLAFGAGPTLVSADNEGSLAVWEGDALGR